AISARDALAWRGLALAARPDDADAPDAAQKAVLKVDQASASERRASQLRLRIPSLDVRAVAHVGAKEALRPPLSVEDARVRVDAQEDFVVEILVASVDAAHLINEAVRA